MRKELQKAYQLASDAATKSHLKNKARYGHRVGDLPLEKGDRILIQNVGLKGKHKLQDRWKSTPYVVLEKSPNLPVYMVRPEHGPDVIKTLHLDHLLPIGYMVRMSNLSDDKELVRRPVTRAQLTRQRQSTTKSTDPVEESDTESSGSESETVHNKPDFDVEEVQRKLAAENQSSEEDKRSEEENCEAADSQQLTETEYEEFSEGVEPTESISDVKETNNDSVEEQDVEGRASLPLSNTSNKSSKNPRSETEWSSTVRKSLRKPKPTVRLTYEKPGHQSCEPVTIMHHGMVIQLKLNPPDQDTEPRKSGKHLKGVKRRRK